MPFEKRLEMMQKRRALLSEMVKGYTDFDKFVCDYDERLAVMGIELQQYYDHLYLYISLGFNEYEGYHIVRNKNGQLVVSPIILWQDDYCANDYLNIFTGDSVEKEEIFGVDLIFYNAVSQNATYFQ